MAITRWHPLQLRSRGRGGRRQRRTLQEWRPLAELIRSQRRFDRLLDRALSSLWDGGRFFARRATWSPPADIYQTDNDVVIAVDLAGVDPQDVTARVEGRTLFLKGTRKREGKAKDYYLAERTYGPFALSFTLPSSVDPDNVQAEYRHGVLTLRVAKREAAKPKTIRIQVEEQPTQTAAAHA